MIVKRVCSYVCVNLLYRNIKYYYYYYSTALRILVHLSFYFNPVSQCFLTPFDFGKKPNEGRRGKGAEGGVWSFDRKTGKSREIGINFFPLLRNSVQFQGEGVGVGEEIQNPLPGVFLLLNFIHFILFIFRLGCNF